MNYDRAEREAIMAESFAADIEHASTRGELVRLGEAIKAAPLGDAVKDELRAAWVAAVGEGDVMPSELAKDYACRRRPTPKTWRRDETT